MEAIGPHKANKITDFRVRTIGRQHFLDDHQVREGVPSSNQIWLKFGQNLL